LYTHWPVTLFTAFFLLPVLYLMDWLDGYVARQKNQVTDLGSVLDIAIDRVAENVLWIVFADLNKVWVAVPILFILRSFVVDGLRSYALSRGLSAFGMMHSKWGRFLVASRLMRGLYGVAKAGAFCAMSLHMALNSLGEPLAVVWQWVPLVEYILIYLAVGLCIARGVPVLMDIRDILGPPSPVDRKE
jgi:Phosphatidylglycerophosphate synthase